MSIGIGIFLSCILISIVILYVKSREGGRFKKLFFRFSSIFVSIGVLIFLIAYIVIILDQRPKIITEIRQVELGDSVRDIKFKHGEMSKLYPDDMEDNSYKISGDWWRSGVVLEINEKKKVSSISYTCGWIKEFSGNTEHEDTFSIDRISCGDNSEDILKIYGKAVEVGCFPDDDYRRVFIMEKYLRGYTLENDKVNALTIYASRSDMPGIIEKCE